MKETQAMSEFHVSVMKEECIDFLSITPNNKYIDATLGGGGHTIEIAKRGGLVLGIDVDDEAIQCVALKIKNLEGGTRERITLVKGNFSKIDDIAKEKGFAEVAGILFDLGVSSHQLDTKERGFSFQRDGALDMRMDQSLSVKASDLVNALSKKELTLLFERYGEERFAKKIADTIVKARSIQQITTTAELAEVIEHGIGRREKIHPATRVFQALRIAVNDELHALEDGLRKGEGVLRIGGRLVVISFHSLEDRIVKHSFSFFADQGFGSVVTKKPILPSTQEIMQNSRARSAKLRVFEKGHI